MQYINIIVISMWIFLAVMRLWVHGAKPDKTLIKKYSKFTLFITTVPFCASWKERIDIADLRKITKYRKRYIFFYMSALVILILHILIIIDFETIYSIFEQGDNTNNSLNMLNF